MVGRLEVALRAMKLSVEWEENRNNSMPEMRELWLVRDRTAINLAAMARLTLSCLSNIDKMEEMCPPHNIWKQLKIPAEIRTSFCVRQLWVLTVQDQSMASGC